MRSGASRSLYRPTFARSRPQACIDQLDLDMSLTCLPVFLSSCRGLLVLLGSSYPSRLWCLLELFVYVQMGGDRERIRVQLLSDDARAGLTTVSAARARCFEPRETQRLLAVIESAFGTVHPFDELLRHLESPLNPDAALVA